MSKLDELIKELCPNGVEFKPLEECCVSLDNKRKPVTKAAREEGEYPYYGANGIQDYVSDYIFDGTFVLVGEDGSVITDRGTPIVNWAEGKIWVNNHAHIISEKEGVSLRYLYHVTKKVDILILGEAGSAAWKYGNYGSKYEKARQLQEKGSNIIVVKEQDIIK